MLVPRCRVRFLGVELDQSLIEERMAEMIIFKSNAKFKSRQTKHVNMKSRQILTSALILCHFDYVCSS